MLIPAALFSSTPDYKLYLGVSKGTGNNLLCSGLPKPLWDLGSDTKGPNTSPKQSEINQKGDQTKQASQIPYSEEHTVSLCHLSLQMNNPVRRNPCNSGTEPAGRNRDESNFRPVPQVLLAGLLLHLHNGPLHSNLIKVTCLEFLADVLHWILSMLFFQKLWT